MPNMDYGPRGSEIVRRFFNGAKDTLQHAHKQKQWSVSLAPGPHLFTDWRHIPGGGGVGGIHLGNEGNPENPCESSTSTASIPPNPSMP